jgi:putative ABC transport system substrate-binding protein
MKRREFIALLGGAATLPLAARGQQSGLQLIGFLSGFSPAGGEVTLAAFRQGLSDTGFVEHRNIGIEYRWAEGRYDRLPAMAADLARREMAVILTDVTAAAMAATTTIPIVFLTAGNPVEFGLVTSLSRPGGNLTGATSYVAQLASRQLEVLHGLVPTAVTTGVFMNPHARANAEPQVRDLLEAAKALGLRLHVIEVGGEGDLATAFATLAGARADALFVTADGFLHNQLRDPIVALAARHQLPAMYVYRDCVEAGGLICYTSSLFDAGRQAGVFRATEKTDAQAGLLVVKILERRAMLLGLDSPQKLDIVQVQAQEAPSSYDKIRDALMSLKYGPNGRNGNAGAVDALSDPDDTQ